MSYPLGTEILFRATFRNDAGADADPTTIVFKITPEAGTEASFTYALSQITKDAVGKYSIKYRPASAGRWFACWIGDGAVKAASRDIELVILATRLTR